MKYKLYLAILLLGIRVSSFAMNRSGIFNDDKQNNAHSAIQYARDAQNAINGLLINLTKEEDKVKVASAGHWQIVGRRGPFTVVKEIPQW